MISTDWAKQMSAIMSNKIIIPSLSIELSDHSLISGKKILSPPLAAMASKIVTPLNRSHSFLISILSKDTSGAVPRGFHKKKILSNMNFNTFGSLSMFSDVDKASGLKPRLY